MRCHSERSEESKIKRKFYILSDQVGMLHYRYRSERQDCELLPEYFTYYKTKHEKNLI